MDLATAQQIERDFSESRGYQVTASAHGVLVTEDEGRTSFFTDQYAFFQFTEQLIDRLHPVPRLPRG